MSRAGPVSRAGSVYRDDCSARYYMRQASPPAAEFRSCRVKKWLHQRASTKCFYCSQFIILAYYFHFYVALWSDKPLCVIQKEKYRSSGEPFCSEAKFWGLGVSESRYNYPCEIFHAIKVTFFILSRKPAHSNCSSRVSSSPLLIVDRTLYERLTCGLAACNQLLWLWSLNALTAFRVT